MSAIRAERDYVIHEDFMKVNHFLFKCFSLSAAILTVTLIACAFRSLDICFISLSLSQAVRKLNEAKKLESSSHYSTDFGKD